MELGLCTVDTDYIDYLRHDCGLKMVLDNKDDSEHGRRYLGVVFTMNGYKYYAPLSSPKDSDYIWVNGIRKIRKSIITMIRMTAVNKNGELELKGKIQLNNMIPVPESCITYYDISAERDKNYKIIVEKEYTFIKSNQKRIIGNAKILYSQKVKEHIYYTEENAEKSRGI